jgi:hypothetical protein
MDEVVKAAKDTKACGASSVKIYHGETEVLRIV